MQIPINKEIRHYQEEIFLGLNLRQMICSGTAIAVGADGEVSLCFNSEGMYRGQVGVTGEPLVAIYGEDALATA